MKKKNKSQDILLIDLSARKNIKIIHAKKKKVSEKEVKEFEEKLLKRYNDYCEFTDFCIQQNMKKNTEQISNESFVNIMKNMMDENDFLENMLREKKLAYNSGK